MNNEIAQEALSRALNSKSLINYSTIYTEFMARGIPEAEIQPRKNVFTFHAWRALGRVVKKGEHGVRVITWITTEEKRNDAGEVTHRASYIPKTSVVFHVSQTKSPEEKAT